MNLQILSVVIVFLFGNLALAKSWDPISLDCLSKDSRTRFQLLAGQEFRGAIITKNLNSKNSEEFHLVSSCDGKGNLLKCQIPGYGEIRLDSRDVYSAEYLTSGYGTFGSIGNIPVICELKAK